MTTATPPKNEQAFLGDLLRSTKSFFAAAWAKVRGTTPALPVEASPHEHRQTLIEARGIEADHLSRVMDQAAQEPGLEEALEAGDSVWADHLKGKGTGEFRGVPGSTSRARS